MAVRGIDVSKWQGAIDFAKVKAAGFEFVIIKAGGWSPSLGFYKDPYFEANYFGATNVGLGVGAYFYTSEYFTGKEQGEKEAALFRDYIVGKKFNYPVAVDVEEVGTGDKAGVTEAVIAFCESMENAGYYITIYASDISGFKERMNLNELSAYDKWVARYNTMGPQYVTAYGMWQYGGSQNYIRNVKVDGVSSAACDQNFAYKDYPSIIVNAGLNGYKAEQPATAELTTYYGDPVVEKFVKWCEENNVDYSVVYD